MVLPFQLFLQITTGPGQTWLCIIVCQENASLAALVDVLAAWKLWDSVPGALIILTWKRDSRPASQGSVTPGKPDPRISLRDLHRSTKDSTSPVSQAAEPTAGNCNFMRLQRPAFFIPQQFFQRYSDLKHRDASSAAGNLASAIGTWTLRAEMPLVHLNATSSKVVCRSKRTK